MAEEKQKKQQTALLIGGAIVLGAIGYYYYSSQSESKQEPNSATIEQVTYANANADTFQSNKIDDSNQYDSKSEDDPDDAPIINGVDEIEQPANSDNKQEEEPDAVTTVNEILKEEKEAENANSPKEESSVMEDSPVIVNTMDTDSEPIVVKQMVDAPEPAQEHKATGNEVVAAESKSDGQEATLKTLTQKSDDIADTVSKHKKLQYKNGKLTVALINLVNIDKSEQDKNEVLVKLNLAEHKEQILSAKGIVNDGEVEFNERFTLDVNDTLSDVLVVSVENNGKEIGAVEIKVIDIVGSEGQCVKNRGFQVVGSKSKCMLYLDLMYFEFVDMDKTES